MILYQDCSSHLDSSKNMAARGWGLFSLHIDIENFKNLVRNHCNDFHIILQKCSFGDPLPRLFEPFGFVKKHGRQGGGAFIYIENFKNLLVRNQWTDFLYNLAGLFLWSPSTKVVQAVMIRKKIWLQGSEAYFPYISIQKT